MIVAPLWWCENGYNTTMPNLTLIKFGGSTITDKHQPETPNLPIIAQLAAELQAVRAQQPTLPLLIGHGSGSFGHTYAAQYGVHTGLSDTADWRGYALTGAAAGRLNRIVVDTLLAAGLPALAVQPSASLRCERGVVVQWHTATLDLALARGLVPVIYGDVAFDLVQGSAIASTEALFTYLVSCTELVPARIILVGETAVYTADPYLNPHAERVPLITTANIDTVLAGAAGSRAVDVTGGMRSKLQLMWQLIEALPSLQVHLITAERGALQRALLDADADLGTRMRLH